MDQRQTFGNLAELKAILLGLRQSQSVVSLLIDRGGLMRVEGIVAAVDDDQHSSGTAFTIVSEEKAVIHLHEVIAVNGVFHSDYTEC